MKMFYRLRRSGVAARVLPRIAVCALSVAVAACGWQLRGSQNNQSPLPAIRVVSEDNYSQIARTLRDVWQRQNGDNPGEARYTLQVISETMDRRPVTFTANGTPAQYEMTLQVTYAVQPVGALQPATPRTVFTHRIFDFDPRNVVAKSEEERALLRHMRQQLAQQILNELSRLDRDAAEQTQP